MTKRKVFRIKKKPIKPERRILTLKLNLTGRFPLKGSMDEFVQSIKDSHPSHFSEEALQTLPNLRDPLLVMTDSWREYVGAEIHFTYDECDKWFNRSMDAYNEAKVVYDKWFKLNKENIKREEARRAAHKKRKAKVSALTHQDKAKLALAKLIEEYPDLAEELK